MCHTHLGADAMSQTRLERLWIESWEVLFLWSGRCGLVLSTMRGRTFQLGVGVGTILEHGGKSRGALFLQQRAPDLCVVLVRHGDGVLVGTSGKMARVGGGLHGECDVDGPLLEAMQLVQAPEGAKEVVEAEGDCRNGSKHLLVVGLVEGDLEIDIDEKVRQRKQDGDEVQKAIAEGAADGLPAIGDEVVQVQKGPGKEDGDVDGRDDLQ